MSYASLAAPLLPTIELPFAAVQKMATLAMKSVALAATLWVLLAAPGFLTDRTALRAPLAVTR